MIKLNDCGVELKRVAEDGTECHIYARKDNPAKTFTGITGFIRNMLRPDEYNDVPEAILERAKQKGDLVHRECELANSGLEVTDPTPETEHYLELVKDNGLQAIESEYVVSDLDYFATSVDVVLAKGDRVILGDYKTTYKLDIPYLTAQLNVMRYLFEQQNPHLRVSKLVAFWLRPDHGELRELELLDRETVKDMLEGWRLGAANIIPEQLKDVKPVPEDLERFAAVIPVLEESIKALKARVDNAKLQIMQAMTERNETKWECGNAKFSITKGSTRKSLDSDAFSSKYPLICQDPAIWKETVTKDSLRATYKKAK